MQLALSFSRRSTRMTQKDRVLAMLWNAYKRGEWVTNVQFLEAVPRLPNFRSRFREIKAELKASGLTIGKAQCVHTGVWKYRIEVMK
jgi:hypothetical protein